jgi:hypothetical protein
MDFITDLLPSMLDNNVYDSILVIVDCYTKLATYIRCTKTFIAETLAELLERYIVNRFLVPAGIVSDRGSVSTS